MHRGERNGVGIGYRANSFGCTVGFIHGVGFWVWTWSVGDRC